MSFLSQLGLQKRIMLYVTIGLVVIALVYTYVGLRAIEQSTEMVFQERLTMAQTIAGQVDNLLEQVVDGGEIELTHASYRLTPSLNIAGSGYIVDLVDQNGKVLASTEAGRRGKPSIHIPLFTTQIRAQQADVRVHELPGHPHIVAYAPLERASWGVFVEQEEDVALRLPNLLRTRLALLGIFALAAGLATAWLTTRSVVGPVTHLIAATRRIAGGDLDHPVAVQGQDEIGQLAAAFERMRQDLAAERRRVQDLAILEERDRLAREMHDGFAQALSVLNLSAQAARRAMVAGDATQATQALDALDQIIDQTYADVREAISGLRTLAPHRKGLIATVGQYLEEFGLQYGIDTELGAEGTEDISFTATQEIQLLRIIQEALSNVRKHAEADHVQVQFQRVNSFSPKVPSDLPLDEAKGHEVDEIQITIADDGIGFDLAEIERLAKRTFGLAIMRERAESLKGSFRLDTHPGDGTTVLVRIPLAQEGSECHGAHAHPVGG